MKGSDKYDALLKTYPETISKEQLWKLCRISKRVAKYYLDNGIIPCVNTGHMTHKYQIKTADAIAFLRDREKSPEKYRTTGVGGSGGRLVRPVNIHYDDQTVMNAYKSLLLRNLCGYPDLMTVDMLAELTGYSKSTVLSWQKAGYIRWFVNRQQRYAPKELVLQHLLSKEFRNIRNKSQTHKEWVQELYWECK